MSQIRRSASILPYDVYFVENPDGCTSSIAGSPEAFSPYYKPLDSSTTNPRIVCHQCRLMLEYTRGASYVQCASCHSLNAVIEGTIQGGRTFNMICAVCGVSNLAPYGCRFVRCVECQTVSDVSTLYTQSSNEPPFTARHTSVGGVMTLLRH
jgi:LSD1 subclass zinc finger protein